MKEVKSPKKSRQVLVEKSRAHASPKWVVTKCLDGMEPVPYSMFQNPHEMQ